MDSAVDSGLIPPTWSNLILQRDSAVFADMFDGHYWSQRTVIWWVKKKPKMWLHVL